MMLHCRCGQHYEASDGRCPACGTWPSSTYVESDQLDPITRRLSGCTDAAIWADEFMRVIDDPTLAIDWGLMVGWFANAIETGRDAGEANIRADRDRLRAAMRYLRACAHLFPHTNTDRDHEVIGIPDEAPGAWCLGCTIGATADDVANTDALFFDGVGDDEEQLNERARQWVREYEDRPVEEAVSR